MILFKITVTTLFCFTLYPLYTGATPGERREWHLFFQGMLFFLPFILLWLLFYAPMPKSYRLADLYLHSLLIEHLPYALIGGTGALLFTRPFRDRNFGKDQETGAGVCMFLSGFIALSGLVEVLYFPGDRSLYHLFTLPLLRISMIVVTALLFSGAVHFFSWGRAIFLLGIPFYSAIPALISILSKSGYPVLALSLSGMLCFFLTALFIFLFPKRMQTAS